jgi:hypothetical protein
MPRHPRRRRSSTSRRAADRLPNDAVELPLTGPGGVRYFVTPTGQVWSLKGGRRPAARQLKPVRCGAPPHYAWVWVPAQVSVHSLVAAAFLGPRPSPAHHVMHLNGDVRDNRVANLRYGSPAEHVRYDLTVRSRKPSRPLTDAERKCAREFRQAGQSLSAIARNLNRSYTAVQRLTCDTAPR